MIRTVTVKQEEFSTNLQMANNQKYEIIKENTKPILSYHKLIGIISGVTLLSSFAYICKADRTTPRDSLITAGCFLYSSGFSFLFSLSKTAKNYNGLMAVRNELSTQEEGTNLASSLNKANEAYSKNFGFSLAKILFPIKYEVKK